MARKSSYMSRVEHKTKILFLHSCSLFTSLLAAIYWALILFPILISQINHFLGAKHKSNEQISSLLNAIKKVNQLLKYFHIFLSEKRTQT